MISIILTLHLTMAAVYIGSLIVLGTASIIRKAVPTATQTAHSSFAVIIGSGVGLVALSPKSLTQFCVSALICTVVGVIISQAYKRRVITVHAV